MFSVMLGMGLTLTAEDFRRVLRMPTPTIVGTLLQVVAMPLVGLVLARAFALEPLLAAGLVVLAACPGGVMTNVLCHLAKADVALSITLTATATMIALFTIPLWVGLVLPAGGGVEMPVLSTAKELAGFTVLPVLLGMAARPLWPALAAREAWITRVGTVALVVALGIEAAGREESPLHALEASWRPALLFLAAAVTIGLGVPLLLNLGWPDAATIGVEIAIKNGVLGLFVAARSLGSIEAAVPIAVAMGFQVPAALVVLGLYTLWRRRRLAAMTA
jgi:BASS family bile acid:Na+ symporter